MSNSLGRHAISTSFEIQNYIEATSDAAKRTRANTIVLVVASVLIFIGWFNSLFWGWPIERVRQAFDPHDDAVYRGLDSDNRRALAARTNSQSTSDKNSPDSQAKAPADSYRMELQRSVVRSYVENVRFVRVPFFGIAFDVNDLGTIGGIGLITILLLLRYSLSREIKNLKISFREAKRHKELRYFYYALAMRQVLTVPPMKGEKVNRLLVLGPKVICVSPAFLFLLVVSNDYFTIFSFPNLFPVKYVARQLFIETVALAFIWWLSVRCWERQSHINGIWNHYWRIIEKRSTSAARIVP